MAPVHLGRSLPSLPNAAHAAREVDPQSTVGQGARNLGMAPPPPMHRYRAGDPFAEPPPPPPPEPFGPAPPPTHPAPYRPQADTFVQTVTAAEDDAALHGRFANLVKASEAADPVAFAKLVADIATQTSVVLTRQNPHTEAKNRLMLQAYNVWIHRIRPDLTYAERWRSDIVLENARGAIRFRVRLFHRPPQRPLIFLFSGDGHPWPLLCQHHGCHPPQLGHHLAVPHHRLHKEHRRQARRPPHPLPVQAL